MTLASSIVNTIQPTLYTFNALKSDRMEVYKLRETALSIAIEGLDADVKELFVGMPV